MVFPVGKKYVIGKPLDMQFLKHVDIGEKMRLISQTIIAFCKSDVAN